MRRRLKMQRRLVVETLGKGKGVLYSLPSVGPGAVSPQMTIKRGPHQQQCRSNVRLCCQKRQQCRTNFALKFRPFDKVERCFDIVAQNGNNVQATGNKVACCFDNVASTLLLVWTGLKSSSRQAAITFRQACGYLSRRRALPSLGRYQVILLGDRGT